MKKSILFLFFLFSMYSYSQFNKPIIIDHSFVARFAEIPDSILPVASGLRLMFRHASVGTTVNDGLNCIQGSRTTPKECTEFVPYKYDRSNWEFQPRGNSGWYGKADDFVAEVQNQIDKFDIFAFKYCYLEGLDGIMEPCGSPYNPTKVKQAWEYLRDKIEMLEETYPDKIFVWWTIPLTQVGQYCTDTLNSVIRQYVKDNNKILFDIADIETYDTLGIHSLNEKGWEKAFSGYCGEQQPGAQSCHPNWTGKLLLGKAFWWMMYEIAAQGLPANVRDLFNDYSSIQIFPNPLEEKATLKFNLKKDSWVEVSLYDILGNRVAIYFNGIAISAGSCKLDIQRNGLPAGLYFCRVITNGNCTVIKMVIK